MQSCRAQHVSGFTARSQTEDAVDLLLVPRSKFPVKPCATRSLPARPDQPSPSLDGRFAPLEATNPTIMQRLF